MKKNSATRNDSGSETYIKPKYEQPLNSAKASSIASPGLKASVISSLNWEDLSVRGSNDSPSWLENHPKQQILTAQLAYCSQIASSSSPEHLGWRWRRCFWCKVIIQLVAKASPHKIPSKQNEKQFLASWRYSCSTIATQLPNLCTMCTFYDIVQTIDASLHNSPVCLLHTVVINVKNVHVQDNAVCTWEFCTTSPVCTRGGVPCRLTRDKLNPSHSLFSIAPTKARCLHWGSLKGAIMHNCTKWTTPVHKYSYKCFDLGVLHKIDRSFELTRLNVQILNIRQYSVLIIKYIIL